MPEYLIYIYRVKMRAHLDSIGLNTRSVVSGRIRAKGLTQRRGRFVDRPICFAYERTAKKAVNDALIT